MTVTNIKLGENDVQFTQDLNKGGVYEYNFTDLNGDSITPLYKDGVQGNDLVVSAGNYFYATAHVEGTIDGQAVNTDFRFELQKYQLADPTKANLTQKALLDNHEGQSTMMWRATEAYDTTVTPPSHLYLDNTDFADLETPVVFDEANITNIQVWKVVNGNKTDYTATYVGGINTANILADGYAQTMCDNQRAGTVIVKDFGKNTGAVLSINGVVYEYTRTVLPADIDEAVVKGKVTGTSANDVIDASLYVSPDGVKGLTFNTGSGNDNITGSDYNDSVNVKSFAGERATVREDSGENKITMGKGDDIVNINAGVTSNTIKTGDGADTVNIAVGSIGINKITGGKGVVTTAANTATINALGIGTVGVDFVGVNQYNLNGGINTLTSKSVATKYDKNGAVKELGTTDYVKVGGDSSNKITTGAGNDRVEVLAAAANSVNTIKTGSGNDTVSLTGGINTVDAGAGNDVFIINNGKNNIKSGAGVDTFTITGGTNFIDAGAGDDEFTVTGGNSFISGGAGDDVYDASGLNLAADTLVINDTKGINDLSIGNKANIFVDVTVDKNGNLKSVGKEMLFTNAAAFNGFGGKTTGVDITVGKDGLSQINVGYSAYRFDIDNLTEQVAGWLAQNGNYASAMEVFEENNAADVAALTQVYVNNSQGCYQ